MAAAGVPVIRSGAAGCETAEGIATAPTRRPERP
jgi:hypothetical protein